MLALLSGPITTNAGLTLVGLGVSGVSSCLWDHAQSIDFFPGDQKGITLRTATQLTGPWTDEGMLFEAPVIEGTAYSPTVHQHYDTSGKTLIVTYTAEPNQQMAHKVVCRGFDHARTGHVR